MVVMVSTEGLSVSTGYFDRLVESGTMPGALPMPGVRRWDKKALDRAINKMSGLPNEPDDQPTSAYDTWRSERGQG